MKIGLVSFYSHNYGGLLQAFALQTILESMGHKVEGINRSWATYGYNMWAYSFSLKERIKKILVNTPFDDFVNDYIRLSVPVMSFEHLQELSRNYDVIIAGSDQIWNAECIPYMDKYFFLDWVGEGTRKRAYAASFGTDRFDATLECISKIKDLLCGFDSITVRESMGVAMCKEIFGVEAVQVLDPTLLLTQKQWQDFANVESKECNYFCSYILDNSDKKNSLLKELTSYYSIKEKSNNPQPFSFVRQILDCNKRQPTVLNWLKNIAEAKFVITDSFHGTVFSIIFGKQFVCINNKKRGSSRFESLLRDCGMLNRLVNEDCLETSEIIDLIQSKIDYCQVKAILEEKRQLSLNFLTKDLR